MIYRLIVCQPATLYKYGGYPRTISKIHRLYRLEARPAQTIKTIADDNNICRPRQLPCEISQLKATDDKTIKMAFPAGPGWNSLAHPKSAEIPAAVKATKPPTPPSTYKEKNHLSEHKRIGRNIGRIELLAVQGKVHTLLEAGYDRKKIHCRLVEEGGITMSYPTFCYQLKQLLNRSASAGPANAARQPKTPAPPRINQTEPFTINRNPKLEDFV